MGLSFNRRVIGTLISSALAMSFADGNSTAAVAVQPPAVSAVATTAQPAETAGIIKRPHQSGTRLATLAPIGTSDPANYQLDPGVARWYQQRGATAPLTDHPVYCHGYGCEFQTAIPIDDSDLATLRRLFAGHSATAADERKAISEAVRWWERHASPLLGGPPRQHGSDIAHAHHQGATDCIDEATNSTTILVFLERRGFLKHHMVERPESRGIIVNAHSTAIIREIGGEDWAVDMWMHDMGEAPDIMTETKWMSQA